MEKTLVLLSVIVICGIAGVNSLQCYVCNNCTNPTDDNLMTCGEPTTSTTASSAATTASSGATAASSGATTASSGATATSSGVTTVSSGATTASSAGTTASSAPTTESSNTNTTSPSSGGTRSKRSVLSPFSNSNSDGCNCRNEADCECDPHLFPNRITQYADEVQYVCYKVVEEDGVVYRGCGPATWLDGKGLCDSAIAANVTSCSTCDTDKCNGSFTMQYSTFMLLAAVGIMMFK